MEGTRQGEVTSSEKDNVRDGLMELAKELIKNKAHWGHSASVWHPRFKPFLIGEHRGVHIIDTRKTAFLLEKALSAIKTIVWNNQKILFVGTKEGISPIVEDLISPLGMPYVTYHWIPGLLTNFNMIQSSIKKMRELRRLVLEGEIHLYTKRERMKIIRTLTRMERKYLSIENITLPHALFVIDPVYEHNAVREAILMGIPLFAIVDTNGDPTLINFPIPANDDSPESVRFILGKVADTIKHTLIEKAEKENLPMPEFKKPRYITIEEYLKHVEERKRLLAAPGISPQAEILVDKEKGTKEKTEEREKGDKGRRRERRAPERRPQSKRGDSRGRSQYRDRKGTRKSGIRSSGKAGTGKRGSAGQESKE